MAWFNRLWQDAVHEFEAVVAAHGEITVGRQVRSRLGRTGVDEVLASLWAIDCLNCGGPLSGGNAALSVDDLGYTASAGLFHEHCRASEWNDSGLVVRSSGGAMLSYHTDCVLIPGRTADGTAAHLPLMVVNPGVESVCIARGDGAGRGAGGRWRVVVDQRFLNAGLRSPADSPAGSPAMTVSGGVATLKGRELSVAFPGHVIDTYGSKLTKTGRDMVRADAGITIAVTHALDPHGFSVDERKTMLSGDRTVMGWIPLTAP
ncbi:hypothetical protein AB0H36_46520 [Kribbella sp. NPDC050820]|uniref:hypothetical protein n=1 Tax=Kribbella sp. NPDC050820 TaxID=3155408 RepID=UPI0033C4CC74